MTDESEPCKVIFKAVPPDDFILAVRAAKWLLERFTKDAIVAYGEGSQERHFYVCRNKRSITVRPC